MGGSIFGIRERIQANLGQRPNGAVMKFALGLPARRLRALDVTDAVMLWILTYEPHLGFTRPYQLSILLACVTVFQDSPITSAHRKRLRIGH